MSSTGATGSSCALGDEGVAVLLLLAPVQLPEPGQDHRHDQHQHEQVREDPLGLLGEVVHRPGGYDRPPRRSRSGPNDMRVPDGIPRSRTSTSPFWCRTMRACAAFRDQNRGGQGVTAPESGSADQGAGVDGFEVAAGDVVAEAVEQVVVPVRVGDTAQVPGRAVVGQDHPVGLEGLQDHPQAGRVAADVDATPSAGTRPPSAAGRRRSRRPGGGPARRSGPGWRGR